MNISSNKQRIMQSQAQELDAALTDTPHKASVLENQPLNKELIGNGILQFVQFFQPETMRERLVIAIDSKVYESLYSKITVALSDTLSNFRCFQSN